MARHGATSKCGRTAILTPVPCLVWDSPQGRQVFDLDRAALILGRDEVADVQIVEASVSRRHALIQTDGGTVRVTDLGSSSGTRINGAKLTPDLPSSLDPGDFVQLGRVTMTFHASPPPQPKKSTPPRTIVKAVPPARPRPAAAPDSDRWKLIALVLTQDDEAGEEIAAKQNTEAEEPVTATEPPAVTAEKDSKPPPEPPPEATVDRAPDGEMPPQKFLSPREFPDLIEFEYTQYYPVRLVTWDGSRVEAIGGDGRTYFLTQSKVTKGENRVDLAQRAARARAQLDPEDTDAHLELAKWCAKRFIRGETRVLAQRVLELRPNDPEATRLLRSTQ